MALKTEIAELIPTLHSRWKHLLLNESLSGLTGTEVARKILREFGRTDVKVCLTQDEQNCYSPMLNLIGLSEDVAGSRSVLAAAIAAHEVGHAFQPRIIEKLGSFLKNSNILFIMSSWGELLILLPKILKILIPLASHIESQTHQQFSIQNSEIRQFQRNPQRYRFMHLPHLRRSEITLLQCAVTVLLFPFRFLIGVVWGVLFGEVCAAPMTVKRARNRCI